MIVISIYYQMMIMMLPDSGPAGGVFKFKLKKDAINFLVFNYFLY
jgi:hypothetical protein